LSERAARDALPPSSRKWRRPEAVRPFVGFIESKREEQKQRIDGERYAVSHTKRKRRIRALPGAGG
jgi:hypothetical protein